MSRPVRAFIEVFGGVCAGLGAGGGEAGIRHRADRKLVGSGLGVG